MKLEYDLTTYLKKIKNSGSYFSTFIDKESLAAGVLLLRPGEKDTQIPHENDEVYFILAGNGFLKIKDKDYHVSKNKLFFVAKNVEHCFHGNTEDLQVLYFFGGSDS
ncbi:cupin domain-containing protein [archaeon]|nr:cupin domain-containing protein [archaeon]